MPRHSTPWLAQLKEMHEHRQDISGSWRQITCFDVPVHVLGAATASHATSTQQAIPAKFTSSFMHQPQTNSDISVVVKVMVTATIAVIMLMTIITLTNNYSDLQTLASRGQGRTEQVCAHQAKICSCRPSLLFWQYYTHASSQRGRFS